jgi:hypothetical protein
MSWTLNNVATANEFPNPEPAGSTRAAQLLAGPAALAEIDVYNAGVFMQLYVAHDGEEGSAIWTPQLYVAPSHRPIVRRTIFGIQFRSATAGMPAQVTVELIPEDETYLGLLIAGGPRD